MITLRNVKLRKSLYLLALVSLQSPEVLHISMHHMLNVLYHIATIHSE